MKTNIGIAMFFSKQKTPNQEIIFALLFMHKTQSNKTNVNKYKSPLYLLSSDWPPIAPKA